MYKNRHFLSIQDVKNIYQYYADTVLEDNPVVRRFDYLFGNIEQTHFLKLIHPIFMKGYKTPMAHKYSDKPLQIIGLDIETEATTGEPKLLGLYWSNPTNRYEPIINPTLQNLAELLFSLADSTEHLASWGQLDLQAILRLFNPTESERQAISRGLSAHVSKQGEFIASPPLWREVTVESEKIIIYISHYLAGRSLQIGIIHNHHVYTKWIFNISQFFPGNIRDNVIGLNIPWVDFARNTHIIDWKKFQYSLMYKNLVLQSNKQDAKTVVSLVDNLQGRFFNVFQCYPSILVSIGSLTDAAVGSMLSPEDYNACNWRWIVNDNDITDESLERLDELLSSCFSAGYVDQYAVGFAPEVHLADLSSAYPSIIRQLPDLRFASFVEGWGSLDSDLIALKANHPNIIIETAFIEGFVTIPPSLRYHPITIKTYDQENIRATGSFFAGYTLEERTYCQRYGATFSEEHYFIVTLSVKHPSPLAQVSLKLGIMRNDVIREMAIETNPERKRMLDGQQYVIKVIDNAMYGKTVQTSEVVENIDGIPKVVGYITGDRFNLLYGCLITARTRIKISEACQAITKNLGVPICIMTDAIYWIGSPNALPTELTRPVKTPGYFEPPKTVTEFYIVKTGQYEYNDGHKWHYKVRGLSLDYKILTGTESFYHNLILQNTINLKPFTHPKDIRIPVTSHKLVTIGSHDLDHLAMINETSVEIKPFVLSSKQQERYLHDWKNAVNGLVWLLTPSVRTEKVTNGSGYQMSFLNELQQNFSASQMENEMARKHESHDIRNTRLDIAKMQYISNAINQTGKAPPPGKAYKLNWQILEAWYKIPREREGLA